MTNHLRYRDTDRRFKTATDAQLAAWEAAQPQPIRRRQSLMAEVKELAGVMLALFTVSLLGGILYFGWVQGLWG